MVNFGRIFYRLFQVSRYAFHEKEIVKIFTQTYSQGKGADSAADFGF